MSALPVSSIMRAFRAHACDEKTAADPPDRDTADYQASLIAVFSALPFAA